MARSKGKVGCPYFEYLVCDPKKRNCGKCGWYKLLEPTQSTMAAIEEMGRKAHEGKEKDNGQ